MLTIRSLSQKVARTLRLILEWCLGLLIGLSLVMLMVLLKVSGLGKVNNAKDSLPSGDSRPYWLRD